jgi:hypothetical protein
MAAQQQRFVRKIDDSEPRLLVSMCSICGGFVAASPSPALLRIAELVHHCRLLNIGRPFQRTA